MTNPQNVPLEQATTCYHCGDRIRGGGIHHDGKSFCCAGCQAVYQVLNQGDLCQYYAIDKTPGVQPQPISATRFSYLDDPTITKQLLDFDDGHSGTVSFVVQGMHCSSCVWLLESLYRLEPGILSSRVEFLKKRITIRFDRDRVTLRQVVELLASIGYEPEITLGSAEEMAATPGADRSLYYRIGIAGFCFGNIMILSFPEYLSGGTVDTHLRLVFTLISLALSLPVVFYCSSGFFRSAIKGLAARTINLDVPIALGIAIVFLRSAYEILTRAGTGYLDSLTGLVFFLLLGRLFQSKTYEHLNFERNYKSYFPLSVTVRKNGQEKTVPVSQLRVGERILLRNNEVVPADALLISGEASIDYSFVTGESQPVRRALGERIYAGGRQAGSLIELEVIKRVSQSYLTQVWNDVAPEGKDEHAAPLPISASLSRLSNIVGKYFTIAILLLAAFAGVTWLPSNPATALDAITAILIVACPCALALATPFTFGTALRIFGTNGFYLKNATVVESLARAHTLIFDKTGTLTHAKGFLVSFVGTPLSVEEKTWIAGVVRNSHHPLSRAIYDMLDVFDPPPAGEFQEIPNAGLHGTVAGLDVRLGSSQFVMGTRAAQGEEEANVSYVYVAFSDLARGVFTLRSRYRSGINELLSSLRERYQLFILSGDTEREREHLQERFTKDVGTHFDQSPLDKCRFVAAMQEGGKHVVMVGDGLNDAGALRQADVGISVADDISAFAPACDGILDGAKIQLLDKFLRFARVSVRIVLACYAISIVYNVVGLSFAFRGALSPLVAAILMPLSSITVVSFATLMTRWIAARRGLL
jgi:P-type Cu+ transporter